MTFASCPARLVAAPLRKFYWEIVLMYTRELRVFWDKQAPPFCITRMPRERAKTYFNNSNVQIAGTNIPSPYDYKPGGVLSVI